MKNYLAVPKVILGLLTRMEKTVNIKDGESKKPMKAVIYCRVSSGAQVKGTSLKTQEEICRDWCSRDNCDVIKVFVEEGESAKTWDRPQLNALLDFVSRKINAVDYLVVYRLDRFSRDVSGHFAIKALLKKYGVRLISVTEPIDETPTGEFQETVLAAVHQLDNAMRAQRTVTGMQERLKNGGWCWTAPLGYKNITIGDRKTIVPDEKASLIRRLFEEYATGLYTFAQITHKVHRWGLRTARGKRLRPQTISKILTKKVYKGVAESKKWNIVSQGDWEEIVGPELWQRAQEVKTGRSINNAPRSHGNPDFSLRAFVKCGICGNPLTASWSRGRSKKYGYYRCHKCNSPSIAKNELENAFLELLKSCQPTAEHIELLKAVVLDVWRKKHKHRININKKISEEIGRLKVLKSTLIRKNAAGVLSDEDLSDELKRVGSEVVTKEVTLKDSAISETELEVMVNAAENFLSSIGPFWRDAQLDQKQRFQQLVFPDGITYKNGKFETTRISPIYGVIGESKGVEERLVAPRGIEPLLPP